VTVCRWNRVECAFAPCWHVSDLIVALCSWTCLGPAVDSHATPVGTPLGCPLPRQLTHRYGLTVRPPSSLKSTASTVPSSPAVLLVIRGWSSRQYNSVHGEPIMGSRRVSNDHDCVEPARCSRNQHVRGVRCGRRNRHSTPLHFSFGKNLVLRALTLSPVTRPETRGHTMLVRVTGLALAISGGTRKCDAQPIR